MKPEKELFIFAPMYAVLSNFKHTLTLTLN